MYIIIGNLFIISLLAAYYRYVAQVKPWSWKEYSVMLGVIILFNAYGFIQDDSGYVVAFVGFIFLIIGFYSGANLD
tara:strand:+ start:1191 stop:1418 length:228 start_codon:yes stop_codon:yes gene_type:complete